MLTCAEATRLIARRADGDGLAAGEEARLAAHLFGCAGCRAAIDDQRAVADVLRARPPERVSPRFHAQLSARLDEEAGVLGLADWRAWTIRLAPAAAALVLAALYTAGGSATPALTLDEWAAINAGGSSEAALLWNTDATPDAALQEMLGVDVAVEGAEGDGR